MRSNSRATRNVWTVAVILSVLWSIFGVPRILPDDDMLLHTIVALAGALVISGVARIVIGPMERRNLARMYEENESILGEATTHR